MKTPKLTDKMILKAIKKLDELDKPENSVCLVPDFVDQFLEAAYRAGELNNVWYWLKTQKGKTNK